MMKIRDLFRSTENGTTIEKIEEMDFEGQKKYSGAYKLEAIESAKGLVKNKNLKEKNFKVSELGAMTFKTTIFKDELRTPNYEMQKSLENYEEIPYINSGINQIVLFITGKNVKITSEDKYTQEWYEKWMKQRPHIYNSITEIVLLSEICGNSYIEPTWDVSQDGQTYMNDFEVIPDPTRVYYNLNQEVNDEEFWIYQVPYIFRKYGDMNVKVFRITYIKNGIAWQETVYGVPLKKNDLIHFKIGWSRYGYYGRSYLASTINDTEILTQLLKNYAIASRYMALGKKLISVEDEGEIMPLDELKKITDIINSPEDEESITINRKVKVNDMAPTQFNEMSGPLDFVRKDMSSGMTPNFMTPWADMVTYASSESAKVPFELSLENKRMKYIEMLNRNILENVRKQNPKLKDATFEFGEVTLEDSNAASKNMLELYNSSIITLNQLLKYLNMPIVENGDIYAYQRNAMIQQKYQLDQSDVEMYDKPYMTRVVKNDLKRDSEGQERAGTDPTNLYSESLTKEGGKVVSALKFIEDDKSFIGEVRRREEDREWGAEDIEVVSTETIKDSNIIRLVRKGKEYVIYDNMKHTPEKFPSLDVAKKRFANEVERVKLEYDNFTSGDTTIDELSKELFKYVKEIQWESTKELLDELKKSSMKEGYLKGKRIFREKNVLDPVVVGRIDGLFDIFNQRLKAKIAELVDKLSLSGVKIVDETQTDEGAPEVASAKGLMKDLIFNQFQTFNQNQSQNIKRVLTDGVISGKSVKEIEQELKDEVIDWKKRKPSDADYRIQRIASTEVHRSGLQLKLLNWKNMGIAHVKYLAHMDDRVRNEHKQLHNRIFTIDEALEMPEWKDVNCRCDFIPVII